VLDEYLNGQKAHRVDEPESKLELESANGNGHFPQLEPVISAQQSAPKMGDLCPECGEAAMVNEEGCRKCYSCGYSEC
jgi:ribonucleoside-diphosphate reductase alpha chain